MPKSRVNVIIISAVITEVQRNIFSAIYILSAKTPFFLKLNTQDSPHIFHDCPERYLG